MERTNKPVYKLTLSAVFIALATGLSFIKIYELPLGGSVTLLSMLPICMISIMLGLRWGMASAFIYSAIQLFMGLGEVLSWGLSATTLIGCLLFDYIVAFSVLGVAGIFSKKGYAGICIGVITALLLRFISHFISGYFIFANFEQFVVFGKTFVEKPMLYSVAYNGTYMLPEIVLTTVAAVILFRLPQIKKMIKNR